MQAQIALGLTAFALCLVATPLCRDIFLHFDILDHPDATRKLHASPVPRVGGIAIALSYSLALGLLLLFAPHGMHIFIRHKLLLLELLPPACIIFATGLVDDLIGLKPAHKLAGQAVGVTLAVAFGARISLFGGSAVSPWVSIPLSILWLLVCTNALNLIDGLDGLAAGVGLFATLTTLLAAILQGNAGLIMATIPLACCLLAFLRFNFNPASVFLGDCGSLTIGFLLGSFALIWSQKSATLLGMAAPMMVLALPLLDVTLSIGRRYLGSRPIFGADRGHIHHRLLALGFKPRHVALILYGVCGLAAALSLLQSVIDHRFQGLIIILFCGLAMIGVGRLDYVEFRAARKLLSQRAFLRSLQEKIYLDSLTQSLRAASTIDACWQVIYTTCADLHFSSVEMVYEGQSYAAMLHITEEEPHWRMTLTIGRKGVLTLRRVREVKSPGFMMQALHAVQENLQSRASLPASTDAERGGTFIVSDVA